MDSYFVAKLKIFIRKKERKRERERERKKDFNVIAIPGNNTAILIVILFYIIRHINFVSNL